MFWDFGSRDTCRVRRDGSDGWRSPVPRGDNTGVEVVYFLRQPSGVSRSRTFRRMLVWTVYEMAGCLHSDGFVFSGLF